MLYWLTRMGFRLWCALHFNYELDGWERIPTKGPAILVLNHPCAVDGVMMVGLIPRRIYAYVRADNLKNRLANWYIRFMRMNPVTEGADNRSASARAEQALRDGHLFGLFPEGTVSLVPTEPGPFRPGFMKLAVTTGAPVVPIVIVGTDRAMSNPRRPTTLQNLTMGRANVRISVLEPRTFVNPELDRDQFDRDVQAVRQLFVDRIAELTR